VCPVGLLQVQILEESRRATSIAMKVGVEAPM